MSQTGLFEPVGRHPAFQRRGLTQALLYAGMRRMAEHNLITAAWVTHQTAALNPAAARLYQSVGFELYQTITEHRKPVSSAGELVV